MGTETAMGTVMAMVMAMAMATVMGMVMATGTGMVMVMVTGGSQNCRSATRWPLRFLQIQWLTEDLGTLKWI